ncbi:hypothetical protein Tco_1112492 [Tanacetum coccineum]|uniref:Uncharacterized protein n=1 Tax=Tanacetum coccineum TaxID=301880 RepID=A0ABQ5IPT5_9ASTR
MFHKKNVDFAELIWEDFSYQIDNRQLKKGRREIMPYPRYTKIIRIGEDVQEYGEAIPSTMLTDAIKAFIGYSTGLVPPKKTRGKGSKGKQQEVTTRKKTVIIIDDNIITDDPKVAFMLGKSISKTNAEIAKETKRIHETYARLVTKKAASEEASDESGGELAHRVTGRRRTRGVTIRDTPKVSKKKSVDQSQNLKGIQTLTVEEQLAADTMQALKSTVIVATSSEESGTILGVLDEVKGAFEAKANPAIDWGSEDESDYSTESDDLKGVEKEKIDEEEIKWTYDEEETDDEFVHGDEYVHGNVDEELKDAEVAKTGKDKEEIYDAAKADAEKTEEKSSSLSVSSGFGNQFLNLSFDTSLIAALAATTVPDLLLAIAQTVSKLEIDVQELKQVDHSPAILATIRSQVPAAVDKYLGSSLGDALQKKAWIKELLIYSSRRKDSMMIKTKTLQLDQTRVRRPKGEEQRILSHQKFICIQSDADQQQDDSKPKTTRAPRNDWFTQPPRPPTPDLEWNKGKEVDNDWNNPKGDHCPFDLSKPLSLKGHPGHLTVASEYFFNNDLEYLKSSEPEK